MERMRMRMRTRGSRDLEHFRLSGTIWCSNFSNNGSRQMPICGHSYCLTTWNCYVIGEECWRGDSLFLIKSNFICAPALIIIHIYIWTCTLHDNRFSHPILKIIRKKNDTNVFKFLYSYLGYISNFTEKNAKLVTCTLLSLFWRHLILLLNLLFDCFLFLNFVWTLLRSNWYPNCWYKPLNLGGKYFKSVNLWKYAKSFR